MRKKALKLTRDEKSTDKKKVLYFGTSEVKAKEATRNGIPPPIVLSDVYPGYFAHLASGDTNRWGIVEIDLELLAPDCFAPFHGFLEKHSRRGKLTSKEILTRRQEYLEKALSQRGQWKKSLGQCGIVLYAGTIPPHAITKVTTFKPLEAGVDPTIKENSAKCDPWELTSTTHKASYAHNLALTQWLTAQIITSKWAGNGNHSDNRFGLDVYYTRTEKDSQYWWKI